MRLCAISKRPHSVHGSPWTSVGVHWLQSSLAHNWRTIATPCVLPEDNVRPVVLEALGDSGPRSLRAARVRPYDVEDATSSAGTAGGSADSPSASPVDGRRAQLKTVEPAAFYDGRQGRGRPAAVRPHQAPQGHGHFPVHGHRRLNAARARAPRALRRGTCPPPAPSPAGLRAVRRARDRYAGRFVFRCLSTRAQRALLSHPWPGGQQVRVRSGMHPGEASLSEAP
jgi:hypothetical protein